LTRLWRRIPWLVALALILFGAAVLRYSGAGWDSYQFLHPDERFLLMVTSSMRPPDGIAQYLDEARSPLNPRNVGYRYFAYGTLPLVILRTTSWWAGVHDLAGLARMGRLLSASFDIGVIGWVYLLAISLYRDRRIALLAAFFYAFAVLPIQQAHFFIVDSAVNFFLAGATYFIARYQRAPGWHQTAWTGVFLGLALACKISAALFVPLIAIVVALNAWRTRSPAGIRPGSVWVTASLHLGIAGLVAFVVFRITQPEAFRASAIWNPLPSPRWLDNLAETARLTSGEVDIPPGYQWAGRTPLLFPWWNMVLWGTGLPAGLVAWTAWVFAARRLFLRLVSANFRTAAVYSSLIPITWISVLFFYQGTRWVMTMRYFLPLYGALFVLAARMLVRWIDLSRHRGFGKPAWWRAPRLAASFALLVMTASLLWAVAFTAIYRNPQSRVAASEWIYANIPKGSVLACEHWDDALPLRIHGRDPYGGFYQGVQMHWYDEDTPQKLIEALTLLDRAEYIILSSNRLYESIPRLPARYPMSVNYYRALFDGSLGFQKVKQFESFPRLGPLVIPTRYAEEAFTVYDHPVVIVFQKAAHYSHDNAADILGKVAWDEIARTPARLAARAPTGLMLPPERWLRQLRGQSWTAILPPTALSRHAPALSILLFLYLISLAAAPLLFVICPGLPDRGYGLSKTAALLATGWLAWLGACTPWVSFERPWIWTVVLLLVAAGSAAACRQRVAIMAFLRERGMLLVASEAVFLTAFACMAILRRGNPDLWQLFFGGEKPMDFALLTAAVRATDFPLYHPWYSGAFVNYYYFGFVLVACLIKAVAVVPEVAYNIIIPLLYGMAASSVFSVTYALAGAVARLAASSRSRAVTAATGVLFVLVLGNLKQAALFISAVARLSAGDRAPQLPVFAFLEAVIRGLVVFVQRGWDAGVGGWVWYFDSTRAFNIAPGEPLPITEFPLFTFYFGDLHAHLLGMPLFLLILGLAVALVQSPLARQYSSAALLAFAALTWGALPASNTWDAPSAAFLLGGAIWLSCRRASSDHVRTGFIATLVWAGVLALGWLCFLPFHQWFAPGYGAFHLWTGSQTKLGPFLLIHGVFLLIIGPALMLATGIRVWQRMLACGLLVVAALFGHAVTALVMTLLCAAFWSLCREHRPEPLSLFLIFVTMSGLILVLAPEWIVLTGDVGRMNTVFKFSFQAWILFGIAAAVLLARIGSDEVPWSKPWRLTWAAIFVLVLVGCLAYPVTAPHFRRRDRFDASLGPGWDGMAFLQTASFRYCESDLHLSDDLGIIWWLRANASGTPVIAEFNTYPASYTWGNRVSIYTGLPSIIGWDGHVRQQMASYDSGRVLRRIQDVQRIFQPGDPHETWILLKKYGAQYLAWGSLENACAAEAGAKFRQAEGRYWDVVYDRQKTRIYRIRQSP